jgi:Ca-activated chloride channel homolog
VQKTTFTIALLVVIVTNSAAADGKLEARYVSTNGRTAEPHESTVGTAEGYLASMLTTSPTSLAGGRVAHTAPNSDYSSYTIRRTVPEVRLQFTVANDRGQLVTSLTQDDFRILDNHLAVQRIRQFSRVQDLPLQLGLLLDVSDSVQKTVARETLATRFFVQQVLRPQTDRAFLMGFGRDVRVWQSSTGDRTELSQALQRIQQAGYATNLYDGLFAACLEQFPKLGGDALVQRVIVIFSDGEDTDSLHTMQDVVALAQRNEIQIYSVAAHAARKLSHGDEVLRRLSDETGGRFYLAGSDRDFPFIFAEMEQQMRTQYYVSFRPRTETPGFHALRLELTGPRPLHVCARQGYYFEVP